MRLAVTVIGVMTKRTGNAHDAVRSHYDELDELYLSIWGDGLHHGLWTEGVKSRAEACDEMSGFIGRRLELRPTEKFLDVGCGYGRMARDLAMKSGAEGHGLTLSPKQWEQAVDGVKVSLGDWLENGLPDGGFDALIAVESLEHMSDPSAAIVEMSRVVKPGGRVVLGCWLFEDRLAPWERRLLIDPIRSDGMLIGMTHEAAIRRGLEKAGLRVDRVDDLSRQVEKTWPSCFWRAIRLLVTRREMRRLIGSDLKRSMRLAIALKRIWIAYLVGALRYVVFTARRLD